MASLLFVVCCLPRLYKIRPVHAFFAILNLLPDLFSNTLNSLQRYVLMIIPMFVVVAIQKKWIYYLYLYFSCMLLILSISAFVTFNWAG